MKNPHKSAADALIAGIRAGHASQNQVGDTLEGEEVEILVAYFSEHDALQAELDATAEIIAELDRQNEELRAEVERLQEEFRKMERTAMIPQNAKAPRRD